MTVFNVLSFEMVYLHKKADFFFFPLGLLGLECMGGCMHVSGLLAE